MVERKRERLCWYPWLYEDWRGSERVRLMTRAQRDMYRELLDHCWEHGSIPADPALIARLIGEPEGEVVATHWPAIAPCFRKVAGDPSRLHNAKMTALRAEGERRRKQAENRGKSGRRKQLQTLELVGLSRDTPGMDSGSSSSSSSSSSELGGGDGLPGDLILSSQNQHCSRRARRALNQRAFDAFWKAYPRKQAKKVARQVFARLSLTNDRLDTMLGAIEEQKATRQWVEGFIPLPATWLRQERWTDQMLESAGRAGGIKKHNDEIFERLRKKEDSK